MGGTNKWFYADGSDFIEIDRLHVLYGFHDFLCGIIPIMPLSIVKSKGRLKCDTMSL